jgi:hypothetical protein
MGCWVSYGLGTENENLPAFVVLPDHRGFRFQWAEELGLRLFARRAPGDGDLPGQAQSDCGFVSGQNGLLDAPEPELPGWTLMERFDQEHAREREGDAPPGSAHPQL